VLKQHHNLYDNCVSNWQVPEANSVAINSVTNVLLSFTSHCLQILTNTALESAGLRDLGCRWEALQGEVALTIL